MTALALPFVYPPFMRSFNTGASPESRRIQKRVSEIVHHFRQRAERERALNSLARIVERGSRDNWDGYGAQGIEPRVSQLACRFLNTLPSAIPTPDVGVDPDGEISFEWIVSRDRQLTVSLSPESVLSYAGVYGSAAKHGKEEFDDTVPQELLEAIRRLGYAF